MGMYARPHFVLILPINMKIDLLIKFCFFLLLVGCSNSKNNYKQYDTYVQKAMIEYRNKDFEHSLIYFKKAFEIIPDENVNDYFYAAAAALHIKKDSLGKKLIIKAIIQTNASKKYFLNFEEFNKYREKKNIFRELELNFDIYTSRFYENLEHPEIYLEIDSLLEEDQFVRTNDVSKNIARCIDSSNVIRLIEITKKYGWQEKGQLILWHQRGSFEKDNYIWSFFRPYINEQIKKGNIRRSYWAHFIDEKSITKNKNQIYGMYWSQYDLYPIKNIDNVDKRRKQINLPPLWYMEKVYNITPPSNYKYPKVLKL